MNTNIECPACKGELHLHTQSPIAFYFCAEERCTFRIDAHLVRNVPTAFELQPNNTLAYQLT